jgi:hypothetical protein
VSRNICIEIIAENPLKFHYIGLLTLFHGTTLYIRHEMRYITALARFTFVYTENYALNTQYFFYLFFLTLSVSRLYSVDDRMINEYEVDDGMRIGRGKLRIQKNLAPNHFVYHKSCMIWSIDLWPSRWKAGDTRDLYHGQYLMKYLMEFYICL